MLNIHVRIIFCHQVLATGDCRRDIHIWTPNQSGTWDVDQRPLVGHTASVEDIQWSPNERLVFTFRYYPVLIFKVVCRVTRPGPLMEDLK